MKTRILILAAGNSARMKGALKMLLPVGGKPMVRRVVDAAIASGVDPKPFVVIGKNADAIGGELGDRCEYVVQEEQLGTGHAVKCAEPVLRGKADTILVLYADNCLIRSETIKKFAEVHMERKSLITMLTAVVPDFEDWRKPFRDFGRLIRDASGKIARSVEKKDASPEELEIKELNPSFYCFDATWLWKNLQNIKSHNAQREYYLTDLVQIAIEEGTTVEAIPVPAQEVIGVNTPEQLEIVRQLARE